MERCDSDEPLNPRRASWTQRWHENTVPVPGSVPEAFNEPFEALFRIQRGLAGHVSYLATRDANIVFTEYLLYEPILAILQALQYEVGCEVPWADHAGGGDPRRIDFVAKKGGVTMALEVKWPRWGDHQERDYLDIKRDAEKLIAALAAGQANQCFLCVFGRNSQIKEFPGVNVQAQISKFDEALPPVYADFRRTAFGCRIFQLKPNQAVEP